MNVENFKLPVEYTSLAYLQTKNGDVDVIECVCYIWNKLNHGDSLRVKTVDEMTGIITLTGVCKDPELILKISMQLVSIMVTVKYEKTVVKLEFEY